MNTEEKEMRVQAVAEWLVEAKIEKQRCFLNRNDFYSRVDHPDLANVRMLYQLIEKLVEEHNAKIKAKITLLKKTRYNRNWRSSSLYSCISSREFSRIEKIVIENPEKSIAECYKMLSE